jgi:transcriptional regulator with XRE-family HTH domain
MIREAIKNAMQAGNITYAALAANIGVRTATVSDFLNSRAEMRSDNIEKAFKFLGIVVVVNR